MPSYKNEFPSKWVKATELPKGRKIAVTISKVVREVVGQTGDRKLVAYFQGKAKGIVLNMSKCTFLEEIAGTDDYNNWRGLSFVIYLGKTTYMGKPVDCIVFDYGEGVLAHRAAPEPDHEPEPDSDPDPDWNDPAPGASDDIPF